ncbi:MAG TPA: siderophore-interacting protein [Steroidobacteraceae bacterium]|nr:siderophore-interacting protein [Steroidobacteraceae bacterium]
MSEAQPDHGPAALLRDAAAQAPRVERIRHELRRRTLTVLRVERPAAQMVRVILGGPELAGFTSRGFDDHVKLFFPTPAGPASASLDTPGAYEKRDFTPRHYDAAAGELWLEFFLHPAGAEHLPGPAAHWAAQAVAGQSLVVAGPKGSAVIFPETIDAHFLIGDETAVPAIQRRLEELPAHARAVVLVEADPGAAWPLPHGPAAVTVRWVTRTGAGAPAQELIAALRVMEFPPGRCFFWVAAESRSARAVRRYLHEERGVGRRWIKAAGYWQRGAAGVHDHIAEDGE